MQPQSRAEPKTGSRAGWLTPNVRVLCGVSFFQDAASELLYPILPIFLTVTLGAPVAVVGAVVGGSGRCRGAEQNRPGADGLAGSALAGFDQTLVGCPRRRGPRHCDWTPVVVPGLMRVLVGSCSVSLGATSQPSWSSSRTTPQATTRPAPAW